MAFGGSILILGLYMKFILLFCFAFTFFAHPCLSSQDTTEVDYFDEYNEYIEAKCFDFKVYQNKDWNVFYKDFKELLKSQNLYIIEEFLECLSIKSTDFAYSDIATKLYAVLVLNEIHYSPYFKSSLLKNPPENFESNVESIASLITKYYPNENSSYLNKFFVDYYFAVAKNRNSSKEFNESIKYLNKAIKIDDKNIKLLKEKALTYHDMKDYINSIKAFDAVIKLDSNNYDLWNDRGLAKLEAKDYDGAEIDFRKSLELNSNFNHPLNNIALIKWRTKDYDGAIDGFINAINRFPYYNLARENLAELYLTLGKERNVDSLVEKSLEQYTWLIKSKPNELKYYMNRSFAYHFLMQFENELKDLNVILNKNEDDFFALINKASCLFLLNRHKEATEILLRIYKRKPTAPIIYYLLYTNTEYFPPNEKIDDVLEYASEMCPSCALFHYLNSTLIVSKDYKKSLYYSNLAVETAISKNKDTLSFCNNIPMERIYWQRATNFSLLHQYEDCVEDYKKSLEYNPNYNRSLNSISFGYHSLKKYEQALEYANKYIKLYPKEVSGYFNRANVYYSQKKWHKAIKDFEKVISIKSKTFERTLSYLYLANAYYELKNHQKSFDIICKAIKENPDNIYYQFRASIFREFNYLEEAKSDIKMAFKLKKDDYINYNELAYIFYDMGKFDKSVNAFNVFLNNYRYDHKAFYQRGKANLKLGNFNEACSDFGNALYYYLFEYWDMRK